MTAAFWRGRRVLLTGHTGFKGSWLSLWLQRLGADVTGIALEPPTQPSLFELARVADGMQSIRANVTDGGAVLDICARTRPEIVIHMAAQSLVRTSYEAPVETYATNVMGTVNVLEAVRRTPGVRVVVIVTSDKCYENREWLWSYRETEPLGGYDPYSSSKGCAELVTAAYRRSYFRDTHGVRVATARAGNVIGGGDWARDRLVPDVIGAFLRGQPVVIRHPHATRPWQHVLEPLGGYLLLAERLWDEPQLAEPWNFGPSEDGVRTVEWIVEQLAQRWGGAACWQVDTNEQPHETTSLQLDCAKARGMLGWRPRITLEATLDAITHWYRTVAAEPGRARELVRNEIAAYEQSAHAAARPLAASIIT